MKQGYCLEPVPRGTNLLVAHIVDHTRDTETPGGTPCVEATAICGDVNPGYSLGDYEIIEASVVDFINRGVAICKTCLVACFAGETQ